MQIAARTAGGLIRISVGTFGASYSAPPDVTISGGGGTGAQGVAHIDGGRVQSVVITNAGTGYTSNPTVTISARAQGVTVQSVTAGTNSTTVTLASEVSSTSWPSILSGGTTSSVVQFSNATQLVVSGTAATTGAATLYHNGSGATARAFAYTGSIRPLTFYAGRYNDVYGVDGMGRGIRYILYPKPDYGECDLETVAGDTLVSEAGDTLITEYGAEVNARPIGLNKPAVGPSMTAGSTGSGRFVGAVQMVRGGAGYAGVPTVTFTGGSPTTTAKARAVVIQGRVDRVVITDVGDGYQATPTITISGGVGQGATFTPGLLGEVASLDVIAGGTGYTSNATTSPTVVFHNTQGLTQASARVSVNERGAIDGISILASGTGATATGVTASITGGGGTGAQLGVRMRYQVTALTVANSGQGYFTPPLVTIQRDPLDTEASDAAATASVDADGHVSSVTLITGGQYSLPPTAYVANSEARAQASLRERMRGTYYCCVRYYDDTPENQNGPCYSSISELVEVTCEDGAGGLTWAFSHYGLDDRVVGMELWRSSSDQRTVLFRVAKILRSDANWTGTYLDTVSDVDLTDTQREMYGLMPVTLPSGQINARRFEVPPGEYAVACMFQDRAWYAKDILGQRPNSLMFSEIDEPESVPADNELVVQENSVTADTIQALIPLGPSLLIIQTSHIYKLMYVSQPIIDASITLASYRGILQERCWAVMGGVAFLVDSSGMYAFDGQTEEAISAAVDDYWRDNIIDFTKADKFHVSADFLTKTVRFHYCQSSDSEPTRALCYCVASKAWWEEQHPVAHTSSTLSLIGRRWLQVAATVQGGLVRHSGLTDGGSNITYQYRSGALPLDAGPSRSVAVVYKPTPSSNNLGLSLHYNNSSTPRQNAISVDRGSGFVATQGGTEATLDMSQARSPLGAANGFARAYVAGKRDDRAVGGDRHMAIAMAGTQSSTASGDGVVIYSAQVEGVG
jgi:hypothetical protein